MDVFEPLRAAGLIVQSPLWDEDAIARQASDLQERRDHGRPDPFGYAWYAKIWKTSDHPTFNQPPMTTDDPVARPLDSLHSWIALHVENRHACLWRIWEHLPGPAVHEFVCPYETLDTAVAAILHYYCGAPTLLGAWVVPLNRYPDMHADHVMGSIARARRTTVDQLRHHQDHQSQKHHALWKQGREISLAATRRRQYVRIDHPTDPTIHLALRRDGRVAWILERTVTPGGDSGVQ